MDELFELFLSWDARMGLEAALARPLPDSGQKLIHSPVLISM
jgi:hypothetical protein